MSTEPLTSDGQNGAVAVVGSLNGTCEVPGRFDDSDNDDDNDDPRTRHRSLRVKALLSKTAGVGPGHRISGECVAHKCKRPADDVASLEISN
jgi:hypothetical protein